MAAPRLPRLLIASIPILLLLWVAALGTLASGDSDDQFPADQTIDHRFSARPGVNLSPADLETGRLDGVLENLATLGITYVRFTLPWDEIEPVQGQFAWATWDAVAEAFAAEPTLHPVVVLNRSPQWARNAVDTGNPLAPPHERHDFGAFASAIAQRYGYRFTYYQIWDEPNIAPHWGAKGADPADYLGLLREGAVNLRAVDPDARILAAALAPTTEGGGANLSDITYLDQLYGLGGRTWFDFPAAQPYGFSQAPDGIPDGSELNFGRAALLREVMRRHGDAGTPLWATSFGWSASSDAMVQTDSGSWGEVSEAEQAAFTAAAFTRIAREWPWLGPLQWTSKFGMAPATAKALAQAASPVAVLGPGRHLPDAPALDYRGWRATSEAADPSGDGDSLRLVFMGTGLALEVQGGAYWAYLTVSVDGAAANRLPRDESGASYLVLYDPKAETRLVPLTDGLPNGEHTVEITAHGGWGQWPLRAIVVSSATPSILGRRLPGLILLATAVIASLIVAGAGLTWSRGGAGARRTTVSSLVAAAPIAGSKREPRAGPVEGGSRIIGIVAWVLAIGSCALFLLSGSGRVNFLLLAVLGLMFLLRPELAPPLIAASLPWWQRTEPVLRWQFGLFEVLAWIAVLAWLGRLVFGWLTRRAKSQPIDSQIFASQHNEGLMLALDISALALFAAGLLASVFAAEQGVAWREFRIVFLFGLVLYLLITRSTSGAVQGRVAGLVLGLLAGATVAGLAGLWQFVTGQGRVEVEGVSRIAGFYGSPNNLALILDRAVPLAAALALFGAKGETLGVSAQSSAQATLKITRAALAIMAITALAAAVATFSKGALLLGLPIGLSVVLLGGAWRSGKRWPLLLLLALGVAGGLGLIALFQTPRFAGLFNFAGGTSFFRLKLWQGALNMALDQPVLGVGPDNFLYAYRTRYVLPSAWQELNLSHPHNLLLDLWTRLGLPGMIAGIGSLLVVFIASWRGFTRGAHSSFSGATWPLMLGLLGGLAAGVTHGLIDNSLFLPDLMGWFISALAILWLSRSGPYESRELLNPINRGQ